MSFFTSAYCAGKGNAVSSLEFEQLFGFQEKLEPRRQSLDIFEVAALLFIASKLLHDVRDDPFERSDCLLPRLLTGHSSLLLPPQLGEISISEEQRQSRGHSRPA